VTIEFQYCLHFLPFTSFEWIDSCLELQINKPFEDQHTNYNLKLKVKDLTANTATRSWFTHNIWLSEECVIANVMLSKQRLYA